MSTHTFPDQGSPFPPEPERKPRGCLFYGCIVAIVIGVLVLLVVGFGAWGAYRAASRFVEQYAEDAPAPIPVVERPAPEVDAIKARIDKFGDALAAGAATEPLALSADEINALIASVPEFKGLAAVDFAGDKFRGKLSLPFERLGFPIGSLFPGKFLNGTATIDARIVDGRPVVTIDAIESKGKAVPDSFLDSIRGQNLMEGIEKDSKANQAVGRLESIAVKDGKLVLTPKPPGKPNEPAKPESDKAPEPARPPDEARPADQPRPVDPPRAPE